MDGTKISPEINFVKTSGIDWYKPWAATITVNSQPDMLGEAHDTTFHLDKPDDCEAFLKTLSGHTKLQEMIKALSKEPAVAKAIDGLAASFPNLDKEDRNKKAGLITRVGNKFSSNQDIAKAVASANETAGRKPQGELALSRVEKRYEEVTGEKLAR